MVSARLHDAGLGSFDPFQTGRSTKLSGDHQEHSLVEAAVVEVFDQGGHRLIISREAPLGVFEDVAIDRVGIPVVGASGGDGFAGEGVLPNHGHKGTARFDQASG